MIHLVGAGPGDPGLLTLRAVELLAGADVVLYDLLVSPEVLGMIRDGAEKILVGKRELSGSLLKRNPPCKTSHRRSPGIRAQEEINAKLVSLDRARPAGVIVRLKGGDPFLFGRGGEEALALTEAGIPFEVVPGVTSAIAAPAFAGIPVTHRGMASSVTIVTGQHDLIARGEKLDYENLARSKGTLVFLMSVATMKEITSGLIRHGRPAETPAAVIQWGTWPNQATVAGTLGGISEASREAGIGSPSVLIVGPVVALRKSLSWWENRPLRGRRILMTRARDGESTLALRLAALGAHVLEAPAIRIVPLPLEPLRERLRKIGDYTDLILTSRNAVARLADALAEEKLDVRALASLRISAIGHGTSAALWDAFRLRADVVPAAKGSNAEGLLAALGDTKERRFLLPRAREARDVLEKALKEKLDVVPVYATEACEMPEIEKALERGEIDMAIFASGSAVRNFLGALKSVEAFGRVKAVSIGPVTTEALEAAGFEPVTAERPDPAGLVEAVLKAAG